MRHREIAAFSGRVKGSGHERASARPALSSSHSEPSADSFSPTQPATKCCATAFTTMARAFISLQRSVMPNHVHLLFWALRGPTGWPYPMVDILQALKSSSAHTLNKLLHRTGPFWDEESFDHVSARTKAGNRSGNTSASQSRPGEKTGRLPLALARPARRMRSLFSCARFGPMWRRRPRPRDGVEQIKPPSMKTISEGEKRNQF